MRAAPLRAALAVGVVLGSASFAPGHEAKVGMATETLVLKAAGKRKLVFTGFGDGLTPSLEEHPGEVGTGVLVRADGGGGPGDPHS